jgi:hypothetical protein
MKIKKKEYSGKGKIITASFPVKENGVSVTELTMGWSAITHSSRSTVRPTCSTLYFDKD